jgi:hypothetical protein
MGLALIVTKNLVVELGVVGIARPTDPTALTTWAAILIVKLPENPAGGIIDRMSSSLTFTSCSFPVAPRREPELKAVPSSMPLRMTTSDSPGFKPPLVNDALSLRATRWFSLPAAEDAAMVASRAESRACTTTLAENDFGPPPPRFY